MRITQINTHSHYQHQKLSIKPLSANFYSTTTTEKTTYTYRPEKSGTGAFRREKSSSAYYIERAKKWRSGRGRSLICGRARRNGELWAAGVAGGQGPENYGPACAPRRAILAAAQVRGFPAEKDRFPNDPRARAPVCAVFFSRRGFCSSHVVNGGAVFQRSTTVWECTVQCMYVWDFSVSGLALNELIERRSAL